MKMCLSRLEYVAFFCIWWLDYKLDNIPASFYSKYGTIT